MALTIQESVRDLHTALVEYIEATYHIGDPRLIAQRRALLDRVGVIHQSPYIESTPRYQSGTTFSAIEGLPASARELFQSLSNVTQERKRLFYDPPYRHQSDALKKCLVENRNLVIMTGTGSGKTESFLLPIIGKLAREASDRPTVFGQQDAMRALILYPMNALVNDQLGRLRTIFGDPRLVEMFKSWSGRPPRFARYTSRTPYAGIRTRQKDGTKLKSIRTFFVDILQRAQSSNEEDKQRAQRLLVQLKERGKWPAKENLQKWYGKDGTHWQDADTGEFLRATMMPNDSEQITRHEVQESVPDLLVTNYSMLEYMLMRPVERTIFDRTRSWLSNNPDEKFLIVLDEAHLYRGAPGAEVGLLLRRLRDRLGVGVDRFQVICATASFSSETYAPEFGSQLSGVPAESFEPITGTLDLRPNESDGDDDEARTFASIDIEAFFSDDEKLRYDAIRPVIEFRKSPASGDLEKDLFYALEDFRPLALLVNWTMSQARPIADVGTKLFPRLAANEANLAASNLMSLASVARLNPQEPSLLPCRVHNFFRGLPGLWVCMDPDCSEISDADRSGICGKMYSQPHDLCRCGACVLELFTCRYCGTAYARAYTDHSSDPRSIWANAGQRLRIAGTDIAPLSSLDLLLEAPHQQDLAEPMDYDLVTGQLNPEMLGARTRTVHLRPIEIEASSDEDEDNDTAMDLGTANRLYQPCAVCQQSGRRNRSTVQDHETKGDQPFQALVARQLQIQPPAPVPATKFAPLRGRKVLAFSDSRQVAARLAPNLQMYSARDSLRPLLVVGWQRLSAVVPQPRLDLEDLYCAVLLAANKLRVRLRPELGSAESFSADDAVGQAIEDGAWNSDAQLQQLRTDIRDETPPASLLADIVEMIDDRLLGLEALAIGSIAERNDKTQALRSLPNIPGIATTPDGKIAFARAWIRCWHRNGFWLRSMPGRWNLNDGSGGPAVTNHAGGFKAINRILETAARKKIFKEQWLPCLHNLFTEVIDGPKRRMQGKYLTLQLGGNWVRCRDCKSVQRPIPGLVRCLDCGHPALTELDPGADPVFIARKGFYRQKVLAALATPPIPPMAFIAAEHTAQLNSPQNEDVFSKAEENELLFQDVEIPASGRSTRSSSIDVLSSTTTMEVGIDIGTLSGVALRNMPPGRANYQQRAGRAGRRGNAVATVIAFGGTDTHDEHYFSNPDLIICGDVTDPTLTLDNKEIVRRHILAFLLQCYHQARLPHIDPTQPHDLFSVLGSVASFRSANSILNRRDFETWLIENTTLLAIRVGAWIPSQLDQIDRECLLRDMVSDSLDAIDSAIPVSRSDQKPLGPDDDIGEDDSLTDADVHQEAVEGEKDAQQNDYPEVEAEVGEEQPVNPIDNLTLLDRLLYKGVLPRYAFPTDVATFHVFNGARSTRFRPIFQYAPSQSLPIALSQYAPGKLVWIAGKCYTSGAIYSPIAKDRSQKWHDRQLYLECMNCGYARTMPLNSGVEVNNVIDCPACGSERQFGPARYWMRPTGFAHPISIPEVTSPDDIPETSYATRAKLTIATPSEDGGWIVIGDKIRLLTERTHLLVSNTGPKREGYSYCTRCGRVEASAGASQALYAPHLKPFPDEAEPDCQGAGQSPHVVFGTDFITDVALISLRVGPPVSLMPGYSATDVALRTLSEALARAACHRLEIEPGEIMAEYRPALTGAGIAGQEAEIFLYDTLSGGAGFTKSLEPLGVELFKDALRFVQECPEDDCDASCYRCLRNFRNRIDHGILDRHAAVWLLEYLIHGNIPRFDSSRITISTKRLFSDLVRQKIGGLNIFFDAVIDCGDVGSITAPILIVRQDGLNHIVALSAPLADDVADDPMLNLARASDNNIDFIFVSELLVRRNLPEATKQVLARL